MELADIASMKPGRLLGLDLGTKTIGIAVSDITRKIASPLTTIQRKKFTLDAEELLKIAAKEAPLAFILGLPVNMDGTEGPRCQSTRAFARNMEKLTPIPILYWDERLSTAAVERLMIADDVSRAKRAERVDKLAASWILQGALDFLSGLPK